MSHAVIQAILNKAVREAINASDNGELRYGPYIKWTGWICTILFLGMSIGAALTAPSEEKLIAVCFVPFILLGAALIVEGHGTRITYDGDGIRTRSPWRRSRRITWSEIVSCDYAPANQWYRLHTRSQGTVRLSLLMEGIAGLLRMLPCEHPSYPPVAASGRALYRPSHPTLIVPGRSVFVKATGSCVICLIFVAIGAGCVLLHYLAELPVLEDYREVHGKILEVQNKSGGKGREQLRLRVAGAPALLAFSAHKDQIEKLLKVVHMGDDITALVSNEQWDHPIKPWFASEPQIWMVYLKGANWNFRSFDDHVAREKRDLTMLFWSGIGLILLGLWLLRQIKREYHKLNQPPAVEIGADV
jgi:hypothetical protein